MNLYLDGKTAVGQLLNGKEPFRIISIQEN